MRMRRASEKRGVLARIAGGVGVVAIAALSASCVSIQVEPLTHDSYPPRTGGASSVAALTEAPLQPYVKLASIVATSGSATEDGLRDRILERAGRLGADAVILGRFDMLESMGPSPLYESTQGPAGGWSTSYVWGPWGWWDPFYLDPWSYVQGAADQRSWTMYLSGLAIRYAWPKRNRDLSSEGPGVPAINRRKVRAR